MHPYSIINRFGINIPFGYEIIFQLGCVICFTATFVRSKIFFCALIQFLGPKNHLYYLMDKMTELVLTHILGIGFELLMDLATVKIVQLL